MTTSALKAVATGQEPVAAKSIFSYLDNTRVQAGLAAVAGTFLQPERMLRLCVNAVKKSPDLLKCDPQTVLGAMMASAALGLEPNTVQQQAFLIPYKKRAKVGNVWIDTFDCQFQVGARGFVTLAYRSPHIKSMVAEAIHEGDHFKHMIGSKTFLEYEKGLKTRGDLIGAFSHVILHSGVEVACVLPLDEIFKIRAKSETYRALVRNVESAESGKDRDRAEQKLADTPWVMWIDDMAAKSAIKKHAKQLPIASSDALLAAAALDNKGEGGTLDLRSMSNPDVARSIVGDGMEPPALEHHETETLETSGETFGTRERVPAQQAAITPQAEQRQAPGNWEPSAEEQEQIRQRELAEAGAGQQQPATVQTQQRQQSAAPVRRTRPLQGSME